MGATVSRKYQEGKVSQKSQGKTEFINVWVRPRMTITFNISNNYNISIVGYLLAISVSPFPIFVVFNKQ